MAPKGDNHRSNCRNIIFVTEPNIMYYIIVNLFIIREIIELER